MLVDTCGWIEWLVDGPLAETFGEHLAQPGELIVPTSVQFELYKWVKRERDESRALEVIALTEEAHVMPLSTSMALSAGDLALSHRLSFADALIYATARRAGASLVTCDDHFDGLEGVIYHRKP
ncbi:MAG: type II toxin-antitoxin system VapC family toxin [Halofilum sp. (in: g-proteobacteria)]|nr:type II toxin-antitoxin system VapC family toxin [Halofilum sp. (in: g-proteobacteria)]